MFGGYIKWRKIDKVFWLVYNGRKTSSQRVLVGYIKWRKHRVNVGYFVARLTYM